MPWSELGAGRVAVVGIGNELAGDDRAGVEVVRRLIRRLAPRSGVLLLEGGSAPENLTGALRRFAPDTVLLVDAIHSDQAPGTIGWFRCEEADGLSASTHTLPPTVLSRYLTHELGCRVLLVGIQPGTLDFGADLSPDVNGAIDEVVGALGDALARG